MTENQTRPFADFLREQARGQSHDELSDGLQQLVQRVKETGKKGSITYTVDVELMKGMTNALTVSDAIKLKLPEHDRPSSLFFADKAGNLRRDDPDQLAFEGLREVVDTATGEIRQAPAQRDAR